ncbi:MAG: MoxR family ATPase [Hyperthermus sp.]|nr:MAG: MoxR family ATPase [Hyperthermus sp.]
MSEDRDLSAYLAEGLGAGEARDALEERVLKTYGYILEDSFKPVRNPDRMVEELIERYKLIVDRKIVTLVMAAFLTGRPVLFEGPPGTGKTEIGEAILSLWAGKPAFVIPCSENYNEYRVIGDFHPLMALRHGFSEESFVPRPLLAALILDAGVLVDEIRRSSEEFQNMLLDIIDKRRIIVPELKRVFRARGEGFQVIFTSNPEDYGQVELSDAFLRRVVRVRFSYPPPELEHKIIKIRYDSGVEISDGLVKKMIDVASLLRKRRVIYRPGTADIVLWARIAGRLARLRGHSVVEVRDVIDAAQIVLYKRIEEEEVVDEALAKVFGV